MRFEIFIYESGKPLDADCAGFRLEFEFSSPEVALTLIGALAGQGIAISAYPLYLVRGDTGYCEIHSINGETPEITVYRPYMGSVQTPEVGRSTFN